MPPLLRFSPVRLYPKIAGTGLPVPRTQFVNKLLNTGIVMQSVSYVNFICTFMPVTVSHTLKSTLSLRLEAILNLTVWLIFI